MRALALLLSLALALPAAAAEDAPLLAPEVPGAVCYSPEQRLNIARALTDLRIENEKKEEALKASPPWLLVVVVGVVALGAGGALGYYAARR